MTPDDYPPIALQSHDRRHESLLHMYTLSEAGFLNISRYPDMENFSDTRCRTVGILINDSGGVGWKRGTSMIGRGPNPKQNSEDIGDEEYL